MLIPLKFHRNQRLSVKSIIGIEVATRNDKNLTMQKKLISVVGNVQAYTEICQENTESIRRNSWTVIGITLLVPLLEKFYKKTNT